MKFNKNSYNENLFSIVYHGQITYSQRRNHVDGQWPKVILTEDNEP
jgi:hypothetical protein